MTAPKVTEQEVDGFIVGATFTVLPSGRTTVCEITLANGFTVRGDSSVVSIENFDAQIGRDIAYKEARGKVWQLLGFRLAQNIHEGRIVG